MQPLESFTAIGNVLGRTRRLSFNELDGLTISNVNAREATAIFGALEKLDGQLLADLLAGRKLTAVADAAAPPKQPSGAPNAANWEPSAPRPAPEAAQPAQTPPDAPKTAPPEPARAGPPKTRAAQGASSGPEARHARPLSAQVKPPKEPALPVDKPPALSAVETPAVEPAPTPTPDVPVPTAAEVLGATPVATPKKARKPKAPKKAPPRMGEMSKVPKTGDDFDGAKITKVVEHTDGGQLLVLADGSRVKVDKRGKEVARTEAPPADLDLSADLTPADKIELKPRKEKPKSDGYPQAIMDTRIVREVIKHLIGSGLDGADEITGACLDLRAQGAKSFTGLDDDAVRRRVRSSLTIMDRA